jgi:hypothetical protein
LLAETVNSLTVSQLNGLSVGQVSALMNSPNSGAFSDLIKTSLDLISQNKQANLGESGVTTTTANPNNGFKFNINLISLIFCFLIFKISIN